MVAAGRNKNQDRIGKPFSLNGLDFGGRGVKNSGMYN